MQLTEFHTVQISVLVFFIFFHGSYQSTHFTTVPLPNEIESNVIDAPNGLNPASLTIANAASYQWPWVGDNYGTHLENLTQASLNFDNTDIVLGILAGPLHVNLKAMLNVVDHYDFATISGSARTKDIWKDASEISGSQCPLWVYSSGTELASILYSADAPHHPIYGVSKVPIVFAQIMECVDGNIIGESNDVADAILWLSGAPVANIPLNTRPVKTIIFSGYGFGACDEYMQSAINFAVGEMGVKIYFNNGFNNYDWPSTCGNVYKVMPSASDGTFWAYYTNYARRFGDFGAPGGQQKSTGWVGIPCLTINSANHSELVGYLKYGDNTATMVAAILDVVGTLYNPQFTPYMAMRDWSSSLNCTDGGCGAGIMSFLGDVAYFPTSSS